MAGRIRSYMRGKLVDQIDFDSSTPFSTAGGYGEIYRGSLIREVHLDGSPHRFCYVALKSMRCGTDDDDNRLEKIIDEAAVWKALEHPYVLRFLGLLMDNRGTYLVSPFAAYGSLPQYLAQNPEADCPTFLAQMAAGLAYLHKMGIVHGDVKGANVLVFEGPSARICDFGLAKLADPSPATTQNPVGTWNWMSPEQMILGQTRTKASDVYAFGLTIYEILSGNIPFAGLDFVLLIQAVHVGNERPPTQPESSSTGVSYALLWMLAARCWNQSADGRPPMEEARDIIISSIGSFFIDTNHDDLPVLVAPPPPAVVTIHKGERISSLPESTGTSDTYKSDAILGSTQHDRFTGKLHNNQRLNRTEAPHVPLYKAVLGLLLGCFVGWFLLLRVVPGDKSVLAADAAQDAGLSGPQDRPKVNGLVDGIMKLDTVNRRIDAIEQATQSILMGVNIGALVGYSSAVLPSGPDVLFGREEYIKDVVDRLCHTRASEDRNQTTPPRLAILGPGGIGKTAVALAAVSNPRLKTVYGDRVHWVPCEQATSPELLVELIARGLGAPKGQGNDRKRDIIDFLQQSSTQPRLLLLDNFETPWDIPTRQSAINDIISDIANASPLTILLTMRSDVLPSTRIRWTRPTLPPLAALSLPAARELYLDVDENATHDPKLDLLLHELAYMPLAVRLMANRGRLGEMPSTLLALWKDERVRTTLLHQGDDRSTSVMVSVELSVNSNIMHRNPDALVLLGVLAELPGGARRDLLPDLAPRIVDIGGALGTLRMAALVQADSSTQDVHLLSPVRSLILKNHRASSDLRTSMRQAYFHLINQYESNPNDAIFLEATNVLGIEAVNIETLLLDALTTEPTDASIDAAYKYAEFQYFTHPRTEIIENAVGAVRNLNGDQNRLSRGLRLAARLYSSRQQYDKAVDAGEQALEVSKKVGDQRGEASSLNVLGDIYRMMDRLNHSLGAIEQSMMIYKRIGSQSGEVNSLASLGNTYSSLGQYDDAVEATEQALVIYRKLSEPLGEANSLLSLGATYKMLGRYDDGVGAMEQALEIFKRIGIQLGEANCLLYLGTAYNKLGRYDDAMEAGEQALGIYKRHSDQLGEANGLYSLGEIYRKVVRYSDAVGAAEQALMIYKQIGSRSGEAGSLASLGRTHSVQARYVDAAEMMEQASKIYKRLSDQLNEAENLLSLGAVYKMLGRYEDAVGAAEQALAIYDQHSDPLSEAHSLLSLGEVYGKLGRYDDAAGAGERALVIFRRIRVPSSEAKSLYQLGGVYKDLGRYVDALGAAEKALKIYKRIRDQAGEASSLYVIGEAYRLLGRYKDSMGAGERASTIFKQIGDQDGEAKSLLNLGNAYLRLGRYDDAVEAAKQSLVVCKQMEDQHGQAKSLFNLGVAYRMLGRVDDAMKMGKQALAMYKRVSDQQGEANSLLDLGMVYMMLGRHRDAMEAAKQALALYKRIGDQRNVANSLQILGRAYQSLGRRDDAVKVSQMLRALGVQH